MLGLHPTRDTTANAEYADGIRAFINVDIHQMKVRLFVWHWNRSLEDQNRDRLVFERQLVLD